MGRVVTRGRRHRVLVRDDRGVVVGVAEALDLVQRIDVAGRPIEWREVHMDEHLALGLLRPQTRAILGCADENFPRFFCAVLRFERCKRAIRGLPNGQILPPHYSYFGRRMGVFFFLFSHHEKTHP